MIKFSRIRLLTTCDFFEVSSLKRATIVTFFLAQSCDTLGKREVLHQSLERNVHQDSMWDMYQNNEQLKDIGCRSNGRYEYISKIIGKNKKVLNIGVGQGGLEAILKEDNDIYSLDPSPQSIEKLANKLSMGKKAKVGYSQDNPFPSDYFDIVIMSEVIEHLASDVIHSTLKEVKRVLKPSGIFLGTVPADENLEESMVVCPDCNKIFHRWGHVQSFTLSSLSDLLTQDFKINKIKRVYFFKWDELNFIGKTFSLLKYTQTAANIKGSNQNILFIAQNKPD